MLPTVDHARGLLPIASDDGGAGLRDAVGTVDAAVAEGYGLAQLPLWQHQRSDAS